MINFSNYENVSSKIEDADSKTIIYYFLKNDQSIFRLKERLKHKKIGALVINKKIKIDHYNTIVLSDDEWFISKKKASEFFYPIGDKIKQIGITGTNGKTTTAFLAMKLGAFWQKKIMYIGTLGVFLNSKKVFENTLTTPDIIEYHKYIYHYKDDLDMVVVEISSHALDQNRLQGIELDWAGWTSFSQDHLDYHQTMESYFQAKKKIIKLCKGKLVLAEKIKGLDFEVAKLQKSIDYTPDFLSLDYNKKNMNLAYALMEKTWGENNKLIKINDFVPGRFEVLNLHNKKIIIDFAHTPDALLKIIKEIKNLWPNILLLTVMGCGGKNDVLKRSMMAKVTCESSDRVIFTEDNCRGESQKNIFEDMTRGLSFHHWEIIENRKKAIRKAIDYPDINIIIIAGKGEESMIDRGNTQEIHNDKDYVMELIND